MQIANSQVQVPVGLTHGMEHDSTTSCGSARQLDPARQNLDYRNYTVIDSGFDARVSMSPKIAAPRALTLCREITIAPACITFQDRPRR